MESFNAEVREPWATCRLSCGESCTRLTSLRFHEMWTACRLVGSACWKMCKSHASCDSESSWHSRVKAQCKPFCVPLQICQNGISYTQRETHNCDVIHLMSRYQDSLYYFLAYPSYSGCHQLMGITK